MLLWILLCLLVFAAECQGLGCYGSCECHPHAGLISCADRELRMVPNFGEAAAEAYPELDLRNNLIKEVDLGLLKDFKIVHLTQNMLDCYDGVLNLDLRKHFRLTTDCDDIWDAMADIKKDNRKGKHQNSKTMNNDDESTNSDGGHVSGHGNAYGNAKAEAKGEMKVQWAFSMTVTLLGGISGTAALVSFYKLRKSLRKLIKRLADQGLDKNSDDEAAEDAERQERQAGTSGFRKRPAPPPPPPRASVFKRFIKRMSRNSSKKPTDDVVLPGEVPQNLNQWMCDVNHRVATTHEQLTTLAEKIDGLNIVKKKPLIAPARLSPASTYRAKYGPYRESRPPATDSSDSADAEVTELL